MSLADQYDVVLNNRGYMLDRDSQAYKHQTVTMLRQQADSGNKPGEQSLNPDGLWRRSQETWHWGAGQSHLDRGDSSPARFNASTNVNVWDRFGLSALPATSRVLTSANTNLYLTTASGRLYVSDGQTMRATGVGDTTFGAGTGTPASDIYSICSDGTYCYAGYAPTGGPTEQGIWRSSGTAFTQYVTSGSFGLVRFVKGRLMGTGAGGGVNAMFNIIATGAAPAALYTHPTAAWTWTDFGEGPNHIYASGYVGDKSLIYKTAVKADGTALDIPTVAASLPDGEIARSLTGYLGYVVIGTDKGVRFAVADADGNLTLGALIQADTPVYCAEGQDRFVWYGLSRFPNNAAYGGLGRLDLSTFTADLTPAYATDINSPSTGTVQAVTTYLTTASAASEMVTNPGFEVDTAGWSAAPTGYTAGTALARSTAQFHSGAASGLVTWPTAPSFPAAAGYSLSGFTVGRTYRASVWVRMEVTELPVTFCDLDGAVSASDTSDATPSVWRQLSITFVASATTHNLGVKTAKPTTAGDAGYVDDLSVKEVVAATTPVTVYTQSGYGVVASTSLLASSGSLTTGRISYGIPDQKTPLSVRVSYDPLPAGASVDVYLASDAGGLQLLGTDTTTGSTTATYTPTATPAGDFEVQVAFRDGDVTIHRVTLYADPIPDRTIKLQVPLLLADVVDDPDVVAERPVDVEAEVAALEALFLSRAVVPFIRRGRTRQVIVDDFTFVPDNRSARPEGETGTLLVVLKVVSG